MTVEITDFGGTVVSIKTPDRNGKLTEQRSMLDL
jgi:hypothetical protein